MFVLEPQQDSLFSVRTVTQEGMTFLESRFDQFGPQRFPFDNQFPERGFE